MSMSSRWFRWFPDTKLCKTLYLQAFTSFISISLHINSVCLSVCLSVCVPAYLSFPPRTNNLGLKEVLRHSSESVIIFLFLSFVSLTFFFHPSFFRLSDFDAVEEISESDIPRNSWM
jgi:hypothetical protein